MHRYVLIAALLATAAACRRDSQEPPTGPPGPPEVIGIVSGNGQLGAVDRPQLESFVVRVTDINGTPVQGVTVTWEVASGGGSLAATSTVTAVDGTASTLLILGPSEGQNSAVGSFTKQSGSTGGVTFRAEGLVPSTLSVGSGDEQAARFNQTLAEPLLAVVRAADGRLVPGYPVDWEVTGGSGVLSQSSSLTDATGGGDVVTILLGDTVRWLNRDGVNHTATSSSTPPGGSTFDSPLLSLNDTFDFVPNVRTWTYFCRVHPDIMRDATITVN